MPNQPKTPIRTVRIEDDLWEELGAVAEPDRSTIIRDLLLWYVRRPGVKMPRRPGEPARERPTGTP